MMTHIDNVRRNFQVLKKDLIWLVNKLIELRQMSNLLVSVQYNTANGKNNLTCDTFHELTFLYNKIINTCNLIVTCPKDLRNVYTLSHLSYSITLLDHTKLICFFKDCQKNFKDDLGSNYCS